MKRLSVSDFKAHLAAYLRDVQRGETYVITEHRRPVAEVRQSDADTRLVAYPAEPFSLSGLESTGAGGARPGIAAALIAEDRGE
jgi:hypothetical protein